MKILKELNLLENLKKNELGLKLLLVLFFGFSLTLFLHFKQLRVDVLELNTKASKYIIAQVDFDFPDDEATIILKQKNLSEIYPIYYINAQEIKQKRAELENYIIENKQWQKFPNITYEEINDLAEVFENFLMKARFVNTATLKKMKTFNIDVSDYLSIKFIKNGDLLPKGYFSILEKKMRSKFSKVLGDKISEETMDFITDFFESSNYVLKVDNQTSHQVKKIIERNIPQQYTHVNAGEQIIGYNEKVSSRHIAMIQSMKDSLAEKINLFNPVRILGSILLSSIFIFITILYLKIEMPKLLKSFKQLSLIVCISLLTLLFAKVMEFALLKSSNSFLESVRYPIIIPFAALLFSILFDIRLSLFVCSLLSIILSITLAVDIPTFLVVNLVASLIVIITTRSLRRRTEVFGVCSKCMFGVAPVILATYFSNNNFLSVTLISNLVSCYIVLIITGVFVVGLLPILESIFDVLTDITLMEYMDPNNELLRRLTLEIPGSYQHSLVLGNIAEAAAHEINANALFCRVATLYHDIGKLSNPNYFIENQGVGINIHQLLTPVESAQVIISHVIEGETLAKKYRLPKQIIDVIKQHHGTTLVYYFYRKELEIKGNDSQKVDEELFRYHGPKPKTKEAAIIMIADSVEAASRSVEKISEKTLSVLVNKIVKEKADDGQFDDCCLTFEELKIVKKTIVKTLMLTRHLRIKYPEKKDEKLNIYLEPYCIDNSI
ncbi:MAG: HDIG domain-containing metalloprotein [Parachlamydiales bacterium]|jgi:hypothetical protein